MEKTSDLKRKRKADIDLALFYIEENKDKTQSTKRTKRDCPYLGQIKRYLLDFDNEKVCSVTMQNLNIYACLCCGKYFQGKGKTTQAYIHALEDSHNVFICLKD